MRTLLIILVVGCGAEPPSAPDPRPASPTEIHSTRLPPPPPDAVWGDGHGPNAREAVLDARRAVSEQVVAEMTSEVRTHAAELDGELRVGASVRVRSASAFDHAELIETVGVVERDGGFVARAALPRATAAEVYAADLLEVGERLQAARPEVDRALETLDTSVLLVADRSPAHHLAERARIARILGVLGRPTDLGAPPAALALARRAESTRGRAVIRLSVVDHAHGGGDAERIRAAVVGEVARLLEAKGCRVSDAAYALVDGVPVADARLSIQSRAHEEQGLKWRYVGVSLDIVDARSGRPVLHYAGLPDLAHGGGPTWPQADQAVARRLGERLPKKAASAFARLTCR